MNWPSLILSLKLAVWTMVVLLPIGIVVSRQLAWRRFPAKGLVEAALALPLVLPPTVLGFYILISLGGDSPIGQFYDAVLGRSLVFSFDGLLVASVIFNLPFAVLPMRRAFESIPPEVREAAACCGMSVWRIFWRIELPREQFSNMIYANLPD